MIGLGTYAYFWQHEQGLSLTGAFEDTKAQGVDLFQICDYAPLLEMSAEELTAAADRARELGLVIELGTKGVEPDHLRRFLDLARIFDAKLVRGMVMRDQVSDAVTWLREIAPSYEAAGVELALETYEQVPTRVLLGIIDEVGSSAIGICLDPANVVAQLENPRECVDVTSPYVKNVHVKDFAFARQAGWVGFTYSGAPMGEGLHDYPHLLQTVTPRERGINEIVEHWLPWQQDADTTIQTEREWTRQTLEMLRSTL